MTRLSHGRLQCDRCRTISLQYEGRSQKEWVDHMHAAGWRALPINKNGVTVYQHHCRVCDQEIFECAERERQL